LTVCGLPFTVRQPLIVTIEAMLADTKTQLAYDESHEACLRKASLRK